MPEIRTRPDGTVYPITPKKGGGSGLLTLGILAVLVVGAGGRIDAITARGSAGNTAASQRQAKQGHDRRAWAKLGWRLAARTKRHDTACAAHAFGRVETFLSGRSCTSLDRALLAVRDTDGNTMVVTIVWVHMPSHTAARQLKALADADGTGSILPLATHIVGTSGFTFNGEHYDSSTAGRTTKVAEAAPAGGRTDASVFDTAAKIATGFPAP